MKKRLLTILLSAVMVVSMLPASAFALRIENSESTASTKAEFAVQGQAGESTIALTWTKADKAKSYKVYYKKSTAKKYKLAKATKAQKLTLKNLNNNTYYKIYVTALNKKGKKIAKTAAIKLATGNAIAFQYVGDTPLTVYDGVIPFDAWGKAVAKGWSFNAAVAGNAVKATLIEYSDNRVGVQAPDGTKLGVFYNDKPRYEYNMVKLEDMVDAGHAYFVGDVWPEPVGAPEKTTSTVKFNWDGQEVSVEVPYDTWEEATAEGNTPVTFKMYYYAPGGEKEELNQLQEAVTVELTVGRYYIPMTDDWILRVEVDESKMNGEMSSLQTILIRGVCYSDDKDSVIGNKQGSIINNTIVNGHTYYIKNMSGSTNV